jgi:hypothetical protein
MTDNDPRRHRIIACRRALHWHFLEIDDVRWAELEWQNDRGWLIKDAAGRYQTEHPDAMGALQLARRMIMDGTMPTPEQAAAAAEMASGKPALRLINEERNTP